MQKEKIIIKNFGPIKDMELDLRKINIFIGDQGTGKSTVVKLISAFNRPQSFITSYSHPINDFSEHYQLNSLFNENSIIKFSNDKFEYDSSLQYDYWLQPKPALNAIIQDDINNSRDIMSNKLIDDSFYRLQSKNLKKLFGTTYYIPTERQLYSVIFNNPISFIDMKIELPNVFKNYLYQSQFFNKIVKEKKSGVVENKILNLNYILNVDGNYIVKDNQKIHLDHASSGEQSLLPIFLFLENILEENDFPIILIIEEPELNLFPETQHELIKYIIEKTNNRGNIKLYITTHSPYILSSVNNLMYAYNMGKIEGDKTDKIISKEYWLNPEEVACYSFEDGNAIEILKREEGLINTEKIDSVSKIMGEEFDQLLALDVEFNNHEAN